jgi:hypothetical protein
MDGHVPREPGDVELLLLSVASEVPVLGFASSVFSYACLDLPDHDFVVFFVLPSLGFMLRSLQVVVDRNERRATRVPPIQVVLHQLHERGVVPRVCCLSAGADADSFDQSRA